MESTNPEFQNLSPAAKALFEANEDLWGDWTLDVTEWGSPAWYEKMAEYMAERGWVFEDVLDEPPFDENHHRYHTPNRPMENCAWCKYLNWWRD